MTRNLSDAIDLRAIMRWMIATLYVAAGVAHLVVPAKLLSITPSWVPFAPQVIFVTGVFEFASSVALLTKPLRFWAGIAMAVYAICVWPANFKHAMGGVDLPFVTNSCFYHGPRLVLQPFIVWWALYCANVINWPWRGNRVHSESPLSLEDLGKASLGELQETRRCQDRKRHIIPAD